MKLSAPKLADALQVDRKTVTNWLNEAEPVPGRKVAGAWSFELAAVVAWLEARAARQALARVTRTTPGDLEEARTRKTAAEAELAELELAQAKGDMIPLALHESRLAAIVDRAKAALDVLPTKYATAVIVAKDERAAREVGESIRDWCYAAWSADALVVDDEPPAEGEEAA